MAVRKVFPDLASAHAGDRSRHVVPPHSAEPALSEVERAQGRLQAASALRSTPRADCRLPAPLAPADFSSVLSPPEHRPPDTDNRLCPCKRSSLPLQSPSHRGIRQRHQGSATRKLKAPHCLFGSSPRNRAPLPGTVDARRWECVWCSPNSYKELTSGSIPGVRGSRSSRSKTPRAPWRNVNNVDLTPNVG